MNEITNIEKFGIKNEEDMIENKSLKNKRIIWSLGTFLLSDTIIFSYCFIMNSTVYETFRNCIIASVLVLTVLFLYTAGIFGNRLYFDNKEHPVRFFALLFFGLLCSLIFTFVPEEGRMFLFFYAALTLVSDALTGFASGTFLLVITTLLSGNADIPLMLCHLVGGLVAVSLFSTQEEKESFVPPMILSLGTQIVLLCACNILMQNRRLSFDGVLIPLAGFLVNTIALGFFLQTYGTFVLRKRENRFARINDPEFALMKDLRASSESDYFFAIHTAHLAGICAQKAELPKELITCASLYFRLTSDSFTGYDFPEEALSLMEELRKGFKNCKSREAVIVLICDDVVRYVKNLPENLPDDFSYEKAVAAYINQNYTPSHLFHTNMTLRDWDTMRTVLTKEEMYYKHLIRK